MRYIKPDFQSRISVTAIEIFVDEYEKNIQNPNLHVSSEIFVSGGHLLGDLGGNFSRERSGQSVSLLDHLKQGLLPLKQLVAMFSPLNLL